MSDKVQISKFVNDLNKVIKERGDMSLSMYDSWKKDIGDFSLAVFVFEDKNMAVMLPTDKMDEFIERYGEGE